MYIYVINNDVIEKIQKCKHSVQKCSVSSNPAQSFKVKAENKKKT